MADENGPSKNGEQHTQCAESRWQMLTGCALASSCGSAAYLSGDFWLFNSDCTTADFTRPVDYATFVLNLRGTFSEADLFFILSKLELLTGIRSEPPSSTPWQETTQESFP